MPPAVKPLQGKRILVTRPAAQADGLAAMITAQGGEALRFPLLEIGPPDDLQALHEVSENLDAYALAVFISPNAVDYSLPMLLARRAWPVRLRAATVGPGTVARLAVHGIHEVIVPTLAFDSEALLELPGLQAADVAGKKVLILRGNGGRELLAETLRTRGATVDCITCYHRSPPADATPLRQLLQEGRIDALSLSSSEALRHLWDMLDAADRQRLCALPLFVPHRRIAEAASALGLSSLIVTGPGDEGIMQGLLGFFGA